jgi:hypothetical protein
VDTNIVFFLFSPHLHGLICFTEYLLFRIWKVKRTQTIGWTL